jgi:hypothetical protein
MISSVPSAGSPGDSSAAHLGAIVGGLAAVVVMFVVAVALVALVAWLIQARRASYRKTVTRPWVLGLGAILAIGYRVAVLIGTGH